MMTLRDSLVLIGESINDSVPSTKKRYDAGDIDGLKALVQSQDTAGAAYIDVNVGARSGDFLAEMVRLGIRLKAVGAQLVLLDPAVNTLTSEAVFDLLAGMGELEHHRLGDRLPYGFAISEDLVKIAERLNTEAIPARRGEKWSRRSVREVVDGAVTSRWDVLA
ncbi:MAG: hypothetical protein O3C57_01005 [Verrucomicrobia bacterium]|nr:hypothetical protein [Verrucomicrobiota bacterium]